MKILIIGSGAREHALAESFHRSNHQPHVIVSPGNAGIGREFEIEKLDSFEDIEDYCIIEGIDLVFIGPEKPLADGLADHLRQQKIKVIGPSREATKIESSKVFAKNLMAANNIPTAKFETFSEYNQVLTSIDKWSFPLVVKADGLAAGKGVFIAFSKEDALRIANDLMVNRSLGEAGNQIIFEEFLEGWEVSLFAFTDGEGYQTTIFSQDHKQLYDEDKGPNTGGMGAYAPVPEAETYRSAIEKIILEPVLAAMKSVGTPFEGILYLGLMITSEGPKVVEFNCRLGDPEAQTLLPLLETDLVDICMAINNHTISELPLKWTNKTAVCVYAVSGGYPNLSGNDVPITFTSHMDSFAFYGGVSLQQNELIASGGRIIAVTSIGLTMPEARTKVYHDLNKVFFEGMHYRKDIGFRENKI